MSRTLARRIASLQYSFVRQANDMHIFLEQALPVLEEAKTDYATSGYKKDRRYFVPTVGRSKFARRKDSELKEIYDRFITCSLYETFLVIAVSRFESFLADVLREVFVAHPRKLGTGSTGVAPCRQVSLDVLLKASDIPEALEDVIGQHLSSIFFAAPRHYLAYAEKVVGVKFPAKERNQYVEVKATRDLLVHGAGVINALYVSKAGPKARGDAGQEAKVDQGYFESSLATMKRLAGVVKRDAEKAFPRRNPGR